MDKAKEFVEKFHEDDEFTRKVIKAADKEAKQNA